MSTIPQGYVLYKGEWCHPSRVPSGALRRDATPNNVDKFKDCPVKRIRQSSKPLMNKLETEFYSILKIRHKIVCAQSLRFMLGNGVWYKPDFIAWPVGFESQDTRMRAFEVKGPHAFRGGFENLKIAAHKYPQIKWTLCYKKDGKWEEDTVLP